MAGVGIHPGCFTLRELCWMSEERQRLDWNHTAQLSALIFNQMRTRGMKRPEDFHPMPRQEQNRTGQGSTTPKAWRDFVMNYAKKKK